jgi:pyridoxal phosphate enzyme (YggS family)
VAPRLITGLDADRVRANVAEVREEIAQAARRAGRDPGDVALLAATKYVPLAEVGTLARAGITLAGENRAQDLAEKAAAHPELTWDFIGQLQSRKVRQILPLVRCVHSVASDSALRELAKHGTADTRVLVEVDIAGEEGKAGVPPAALGEFLERGRAAGTAEFVGLMTMPPLAQDPEHSRRWFAALRDLAERHGLRELSMGTTQDFSVAVEEGATIVRVGTRLYT